MSARGQPEPPPVRLRPGGLIGARTVHRLPHDHRPRAGDRLRPRPRQPVMRRRLRDNSLGLFFLTIFLLALVGQAIAGHSDFNHAQLAHHDDPISFWAYVTSSVFWVDVAENWQ